MGSWQLNEQTVLHFYHRALQCFDE